MGLVNFWEDRIALVTHWDNWCFLYRIIGLCYSLNVCRVQVAILGPFFIFVMFFNQYSFVFVLITSLMHALHLTFSSSKQHSSIAYTFLKSCNKPSCCICCLLYNNAVTSCFLIQPEQMQWAVYWLCSFHMLRCFPLIQSTISGGTDDHL